MDIPSTEIMPSIVPRRHVRILRERGRREDRDLATRTRSRSPDVIEDGDELMENVDRRQEQVLVASSLRQIVAVGDARSPGMMQAIRQELADMEQAYQRQALAFQRQFQEYDSRRNLQTHLEMIDRQHQVSETM